jgi:hypothetical protein
MKISNYFIKIKSFFSNFGSNPIKDWFLLLGVFIALLITSLFFHVFVFFVVDTSDRVTATSTSSVLDTIDRDKLKSVLKKTDDRVLNSQNAEDSIKAISDPSL